MNIPIIYILFSAEALLMLFAVIIFLFFYIRKLSNIPTQQEAESGQPSIDISTSYIDYLEQEITRNDSKSAQIETDEMEQGSENGDTDENESTDEDDNNKKEDENETDDESINKKSQLLEARNILLNAEKKAAEQNEDEQAFWDVIFTGMQTIAEQFKVIEEIPVIEEVEEEIKPDKKPEEEEERKEDKKNDKEKVFYIEVQGKKIDAEVNKLKDIIYDQENAVNGLKKALKNAEDSQPEGSSLDDNKDFQELKQQTDVFERQINDSKMCMNVLEMENDRLQDEVNDLQGRYDKLFKEQSEVDDSQQEPEEQPGNENINQIKNALDKQEQQILELNSTIDGLELEAGEAAKLKETLSEFTRNSQEMMGCIAILEDENSFLQNMITDLETQAENQTSSEDAEQAPEPAPEPEPTASESSQKMQKELQNQEAQIDELNKTIDDLQLTAEQTERLKTTINDFTRGSKEMMNCITILEEENEGLQNLLTDFENKQTSDAEDAAAESIPSVTEQKFDKLKIKVKKYEKEIIKKDVAYAKLQDDFSTLEREMNALYDKSNGI